MQRRSKEILLSCLITLGAAPLAQALDFSYALSLESEYTDNANRTRDNEVSETETSLRADFNFSSEPSSVLQYDGTYGIEYVYYSQDVFDNELLVTGQSNFVLDIIDEFLGWDLQHTQDFRRTNNAAVDTPDNLERRSILETGPFINWRVTPVDIIRFETAYQTSDFENSDTAESDRINSSIDWQHQYSQLGFFVLGAAHSTADFDEDANDFDFWRVNISQNRILKDGNFSFGIGYNEIDREEGDSVDGLFVTSTLTRVSGRRELSLNLTQQVTDSSIGLGVDGGLPNDDAGNFDTQDVIERRSVVLTYLYNFAVDSVSFSLSWDDEDYDIQPEDQRRYGLQVVYNYNLSGRSSIDFSFDYAREDFLEQDQIGVDDRYTFGIDYNYNLTRFIALRVGATFDERKNDDVDDREYTDNRFSIGISYTPE